MPAKKHNPRKTYKAPKLVKIELRVQEVALAGCKGLDVSGPQDGGTAPYCTAPTIFPYCIDWTES
jgi:hypothetical protein